MLCPSPFDRVGTTGTAVNGRFMLGSWEPHTEDTLQPTEAAVPAGSTVEGAM
jgi:hypothetical protein